MAFIGSLLGNSNGAGFQAQGATTGQFNTTYNQNQDAIAQQQQFLQALQGQNGIGNQSSVYNQLQGVANGQGPNPAQAQLAQATGANTANQAALMAGQRGSSANTGLLARQAAQQGATNQQNAAGQAASLQANQSLGALGQLGGLATNQVNQQQGALNTLNSASNAAESNILSSIGNQNSANATIAQGNQGTQSALLGGGLNALSSVGGLLGSGSSATAPAASAGGGLIAGGSDASDLSGAATMWAAEGGTVPAISQHIANTPSPRNFADGGPVSSAGQFLATPVQATPIESKAPSAAAGAATSAAATNALKGVTSLGVNLIKKGGGALLKGAEWLGSGAAEGAGDAASGIAAAGDAIASGAAAAAPAVGGAAEEIAPAAAMAAKGGKVPALVSPGEVYLSPKKAKEVAATGKNPLKVGEKIPGKAKVKGNSYANDTVPKKLETGGIVIPRSEIQSDNPVDHAIAFVQAHMRQNGLRSKRSK